MTTSDQEDDLTGLIETLRSMPLADASFSAIRRRYRRVKGSHKLVAGTFDSIEGGIEAVRTLPIVKPSVAVVDKLAGKGLNRIRTSYPSLKTMSGKDLQVATEDYYKRSLFYRTLMTTSMAAQRIRTAALNISRKYSLSQEDDTGAMSASVRDVSAYLQLNVASLGVGRNIGDAVVVSKSAFMNVIRYPMDVVTKMMYFFEFVVDRYFKTETPKRTAVTGSQSRALSPPSSPTFSIDQEEERYEEWDETCKERFGKMQRKISVCLKKQPKGLTTHLVHQAWSDIKTLPAYLLLIICSCVQLLKYPVIRLTELFRTLSTAVLTWTVTLACSLCEQLLLRIIKLWTFLLATTSRQVKRSSCALPSPIRTPVQSTATYFENLHETLADTQNLFDMRVELKAEREEIRKMATAAISKVRRRWTNNG